MNTINILCLQEELNYSLLYEKELADNGFNLIKAEIEDRGIFEKIAEKVRIVIFDVEYLDHLIDREILGLIHQIRMNFNVPFILIGKGGNRDLRFTLYDLFPSAILITPIRPFQVLTTIESILNDSLRKRSLIKEENDSVFKISDAIIFIKNNGFYQKVKTLDMEKIVSDGDIIRIHLRNEMAPITASLSLKHFQNQFPYPSLIRINKSTIINLFIVEKFDQNKVWLKNDSIAIGEKYKKDFFRNVRILKTGWKI